MTSLWDFYYTLLFVCTRKIDFLKGPESIFREQIWKTLFFLFSEKLFHRIFV